MHPLPTCIMYLSREMYTTDKKGITPFIADGKKRKVLTSPRYFQCSPFLSPLSDHGPFDCSALQGEGNISGKAASREAGHWLTTPSLWSEPSHSEYRILWLLWDKDPTVLKSNKSRNQIRLRHFGTTMGLGWVAEDQSAKEIKDTYFTKDKKCIRLRI